MLAAPEGTPSSEELTTTDNSGTTEFVRLIFTPLDHAYAAPIAKIVTVSTGPNMLGTICKRRSSRPVSATEATFAKQ